AARYGFAEPSIVRSSIRPGPGMRSICVRLFEPYEIHTGDQVAPLAVEPSLRRLYEFTVGAVSALAARACAVRPPMKWYAVSERPSARGSASSRNAFSPSRQSDMWKWQPLPVRW